MGLLTNRLGIQALSLEDPAQALLPPSYLAENLGWGKSDAGVMVNEAAALRITTAFACIMVISSDLSSLRRSVYQRLPDDSVREAPEHPYYDLICNKPAPNTTSATYRGAELARVLGWGNAYSVINRDRGARAVSFTLLPSDRTAPVMINGKLMYATTATLDGMPSYIDPVNMLHPMGFSLDGKVGLSTVQQCKNAFGLAIAAEKFGAQLFGNGARASGVLSHPNSLDEEAFKNLKASINEAISGQNALRPLILEEGMKWEQTSIAPNDAQFLETRQFQRAEIAALYRVPLHLLQDLSHSTNNNIEHQSLDYIRYTLRPWAVRIEQEINAKLLSGPYFCEHDFNDFQRGDFASQTTGLATLRSAGYYTVNDGLRALRQNTISTQEGGDVRLVPINMVPLSSVAPGGANDGSVPDPEPPPSGPGEPITDLRRDRVMSTYRRLVRDAVGRVANRKNADAQFAYRALQPIFAAMAESVLLMHVSGEARLTEDDEMKVSAYATRVAATATDWTPQNAAETATRLNGEAYNALKSALIG